MTPDPNMTRTTPVPPLNPDQVWPNRHTTDAEAERNWLENAIAELKAQLHAEHDRVAELAATCAVLTDLAQQLTNTLDIIHAPYRQDGPYLFVWQHADSARAALNAAAELGITPKEQP